MTWTQLFEKDALPGDITFSMAQAADRAMRGSKLGPGARKSLRRLQKKLRDEQVMRQREDWDAHDKQLRDGTRTGLLLPGMARSTPASSASPRAPGAVPVPAAPRPPGPVAGTTTPGQAATRKSSFDGRTASFEDLQARLGQLGVAAPYMENHPSSQPLPRSPGLAVRIKQERAEREAAAVAAARTAALERTRIDARVADPEKVRQRLDQLGIEHDIQNSIRPPPEPLKPLDRGPDPYTAASEARRKAEREARAAAKRSKSGKLVNSKAMSPATFDAYLRARFGSWAGM